MKATKMLKAQHREVEALFKQVRATDNPVERRDLLDAIQDTLETHMAIEEQVFYPAMRASIDTKKIQEMIPEAYEEHHVIKLVLTELPEVDPQDEQFNAKIKVLEELVQHHVDEEEKELFPAADRLGDPYLKRLGEQMQGIADSGIDESSELLGERQQME
jgi:iron-sulfur cluster repair protein YtfE (RIC family)